MHDGAAQRGFKIITLLPHCYAKLDIHHQNDRGITALEFKRWKARGGGVIWSGGRLRPRADLRGLAG